MAKNSAQNNNVVQLMPDMRLPPSKTRDFIVRCMFAGLVPMITSSPGIGKSDLARQIANDYRLKLIDFRLAQADITDLNGLPEFYVDEKGRRRCTFTPFDIFPLEDDDLPDHPDGGKYEGWLILCDELTSAIKQLQAAGYKLILDRMVGNHKIHSKVAMMGAGNLATDKAVVHTMSTALQSRLIHCEMRVDHTEWMIWAHHNNVDSRILAYLEFRKDNLHKFDPDHEDKTFACPRTWWFANKLIQGEPVLENIQAGIDFKPLLAGTVSTGIAIEFVEFTKIFDKLPKISDIIRDPKTAMVPTESSTKYAMATVIADNIKDTNAKELITYLMRLPVECQVIAMRHLRIRNNKLMRHPAVAELFVKLGNFQ